MISPDGDDLNDVAAIVYSTAIDTAIVEMQLTSVDGKDLVHQITPSTLIGPALFHLVLFDGRDSSGVVIPNGFYKIRVIGQDLEGVCQETQVFDFRIDAAVSAQRLSWSRIMAPYR